MSGKLASLSVPATANTVVYSAPANMVATATVSVCNTSASDVKVRLALASSGLGSLTAADFIEYDATIPANGVLERTGIVLENGQSLVAYASATGCSTVVYGILENM